jgi:prepilin-type N-terminal cleavage/methylation domain-containing protein
MAGLLRLSHLGWARVVRALKLCDPDGSDCLEKTHAKLEDFVILRNLKLANTARNWNAAESGAEDGFTLVELLIVMAIVTILLLVLIPQLSSARIAGNETAAQVVLKNITSAELQYATSYPQKGFSCNFADLTGGGAGTNGASFLDKRLAGGKQAGYIFTLSGCSVNGASSYYQILAQPEAVGRTGRQSFCTDPNGSIEADPTGGTSCLQGAPSTTTAQPATTTPSTSQ